MPNNTIGRLFLRLILGAAILLGAACAGKGKYQINLLPTPDAYSNGLVNPFTDNSPVGDMPYRGVLYATDRKPAAPEDDEEFYTREPSGGLRLGVGRTVIGGEDITWEEARRISILKNRTKEYPLSIESVEEIGLLDRSYNMFVNSKKAAANPRSAEVLYAGLINEKLAVSKKKDIFIYVHGYNTNFEDPLLVASELWHFLGYDGVFVAYSWPATEKGRAYLGDLEKAKLSSRNLRLFIEYLCDETDAENINIVGYSMGTRVVTNALADLSLLHFGKSRDDIRKKLRVGDVILIGSDLSLYTFSNYLHDGILNISRSFTVYTSDSDKALGASNWLFDRIRLGQITEGLEKNGSGMQYLRNTPELRFVDVTGAEKSTEGNGHHYFRNSPWVSSDLLMTLMYDLPPEERGLVVVAPSHIWQFPPNYIERLRASLSKASSELSPDKK
jgi:esterase/lipase superfamily enzyme